MTNLLFVVSLSEFCGRWRVGFLSSRVCKRKGHRSQEVNGYEQVFKKIVPCCAHAMFVSSAKNSGLVAGLQSTVERVKWAASWGCLLAFLRC